MPTIKLEQFGGCLPAWDPHLLPTGQAAFSKNGYLFSGALQGWRRPKILRALLNASTRMVYRIPTVSETQAIAYLLLPGNPLDGDTVTIGDLTYTFRTELEDQIDTSPVLVGLPQEVLIGSDAATTLSYLIEAVTADGNTNTNAGIHYGDNTVSNGQVKFYVPDATPQTGLTAPQQGSVFLNAVSYQWMVVGALDFGTSYNLVQVSEDTAGVRMFWLADLLAVTHTTSTYQGGSNPSFANEITGAASWLEFDDPDTNVAKSPVVDDQFNRFYFASPSRMPEYNTYERIVAGQQPWLLGVPPPGCAVTLDVAGGGNSLILGSQVALGGKIDGGANFIYLQPITPSGDTSVADISFNPSDTFFQDDNPTAHWAGLVYDDRDGTPGDLIAVTAIKTGILANVTNVAKFVNPPGLNATLQYWVGFMIDTAIPFASSAGSSNTYFENTFSNGPPNTAPLSAAHSTLKSDNIALPANGDTVTLGLQTYTFQTVLTDVPGHVHIGADPDSTLLNLAHAINALGGTPGVDYGTGTIANVRARANTTIHDHEMDVTAVNTTITPSLCVTSVTGSHLSWPAANLLAGLSTNQPNINMWADCVTSDLLEARSYVYTWVSAYGEESPPSPPTLLDGWSNGVWTLGLWSPPANDLGVLRNLTKLNIYRTVVGQGGSTVFFFVDTVPIGTGTYVDNKPNNEVALNDQLASTNWFPPPATLQGLQVMQNGMVASFTGNEIWFCEPYRPHAWPPGYVLTTDFPIVGLGVTNGALVVCTSAMPYVVQGNAPGSMSMSKCSLPNPCSSRASILSGDTAVSYMSPNGLIQVTASGAATNTTDLWFTRENWEQLTPPKYTRAIYLASCYYCLGAVSPTTVSPVDTTQAQRGFTIELDQDNTSFTIWPQPGGHRLGFNLLDSPTLKDIQNVLTDPWTGIGLLVSDGSIWYFDFTDTAPEMIPYTWKSKVYQQNAKRNYEAMKVYLTVPVNTPAQNATRLEDDTLESVWNTLPTDRWGFLKTWVDMSGNGQFQLISAREIRVSGELLRLPDGFKADQWYWEIQGRVVISNVQIATSAKELASV